VKVRNSIPVNTTDPFGLCTDPKDPDCVGEQVRNYVNDKINQAVSFLGDLGNSLKNKLKSLAGQGAIQGGLALATDGLAPEAEGAITIGEEALEQVVERHTVEGALNAGKSIFNEGEEITGLVRGGESVSPTRQSFGRNFQRIVNAGRDIGVDRSTGNPTSFYTIITNAKNGLVTMFPGVPNP